MNRAIFIVLIIFPSFTWPAKILNEPPAEAPIGAMLYQGYFFSSNTTETDLFLVSWQRLLSDPWENYQRFDTAATSCTHNTQAAALAAAQALSNVGRIVTLPPDTFQALQALFPNNQLIQIAP